MWDLEEVSIKRSSLEKYFNCGGVGHKSSKCKKPKKKQEANLNEGPNTDLYVVVFEVNSIGSNMQQCWIDTCVTKHVCYNK